MVQIVLRSTHVVQQLLFSVFLSILTLDFDSILRSFYTFWGSNGLFLWLGKGPNSILGFTHVVEQLSFSMSLSILTFEFDLILGSFFTFWGPNGVGVGFENCFGVYSCSWKTFIFCVFFNSNFWFWINFEIIFHFGGP